MKILKVCKILEEYEEIVHENSKGSTVKIYVAFKSHE